MPLHENAPFACYSICCKKGAKTFIRWAARTALAGIISNYKFISPNFLKRKTSGKNHICALEASLQENYVQESNLQ